jgi:hypothetical protein
MIRNVPAIVAGGGARDIKPGRHVVLKKEDTPLSNLWLTLLQQAGVPARSFGGSTGVLSELLA